MDREFEEIEVACIPGARFFGTVEFGVDGDAPSVEAIYLSHSSGEPDLVLTRASTDFMRLVFDQLAERLLEAFAEDAWELVDPSDMYRPELEHSTHRRPL